MSEKEVIYTAHFLVDPKELLELLPPQVTGDGSKIHAHHVTKEFNPPNGADNVTLGRKRVLLVTGHVVTDDAHVALVKSPDGDRLTTNEHAHITIATAEGVPPVRSNDVIAAAVKAGTVMPIVPPIKIITVEGYYGNDNEVHTS